MRRSKVFSCLLMINIAFATSEDNNLPVNISSNSANANLQTGVVVYSGDVIATQGQRKLTGNTLTIMRGSDGKIQSFVAQGNPATTQEIPSQGAQMAHGQAQTIYYFPQQNLVKYVKDAKFTQGGNIFTGDLITYNTQTQIVSSPKTPGNTGTTTIIVPAYNQHGNSRS